MESPRTVCFLSVALATLVAVAPLTARQVEFRDRTVAAGLTFTHTVTQTYVAMGIMSAGGAVGDFNRDGWPDVFVLGGGGVADALFINGGDGSFTDQSIQWGVHTEHHGFGASVGDYDGDGWHDIFVTSLGPATADRAPNHHLLYHNEGNGTFIERAVAAGVNSTNNGPNPTGSTSTFGDYDGDGDLDLFVGSGFVASGSGGTNVNRLFQNQNDGTFVDATGSSRIGSLIGTAGSMVHVPTFADFDGDLDLDLLLTADFGTSRYFINLGDGTFDLLDPAPSQFNILNGMGCAVADLDNNGLLDFYMTGVYPAPGNILLMNQGDHVYSETSVSAGVDDGAWGWGALAIDCDNDGWTDLVATNGWSGSWVNRTTRMFLNRRDGTFTEAAVRSGLDHRGQGRTLLRIDADRDGAQDIIILSNQEPLVYYHNESGQGLGRFLTVRLDTSAHPGLAPDGAGARVTALVGGKQRMRYLELGPSFQGTSEMSAHFGLGRHHTPRALTVRWPDGSYTVPRHVRANRELIVHSGVPLRVGAAHRGQATQLVMRGARPGDWVLFLGSLRGIGQGPCLFGSCLDMRGLFFLIDLDVADTSGEAQATAQVPANMPLIDVAVQAIVPNFPWNGPPVKTNALLVPILP